MSKNDYDVICRLIKVSFFTILLLICSFSLITIVSAAETTTGIGYLNNSSVIISDNRGNDIHLSRLTTNSQNITIRNIIFQSNYNFKKDVVYEYEIELANQYIDDISSIYLRGGDTICSFISLQGLNNSYLKIRFTCPSNVSYITIGLSNSGGSAITDSYNIQWKNIYLWQINDAIDLGPVINGQNQNTQDIINNNDSNTDRIIEENNKNFNTEKDCGNIWNENWSNFGIDNNTGEPYNTSLKIGSTDFIPVKANTQYYVVTPITLNAYYYDANKIYVSSNTQQGINGSFTIPSGVSYMKFTTFGTSNTTYHNNIAIFKGTKDTTYCKYGSKVYVNKLDENKDALNNLDDTLKDDKVDENGVADAFDSFNDFLDDNSTITQLITLPITLYTAILNNLNGTCSPFNLGKLYGEDLILPCINISQYLGNSLWTMIDIIISGFAVYAISKKMIKVFNNFSSLREGDVIDD